MRGTLEMNLNLDKVPSNLDDALEMLEKGLDDEDRKFILEHDAAETHFSFGMWLRNNWSLWEKDTVLSQWFRDELKIGHADDMSGIILGSLWAKIRGEKFDIQDEIERYHKHWREHGIDPVTQEPLEE
jgi:hypothetical protein